MPDPKIEKHFDLLKAMPREFRNLADWGWTKLRADIQVQAVRNGATPAEAAVISARLSRLVVSQMYGDIMRARAMTPAGQG